MNNSEIARIVEIEAYRKEYEVRLIHNFIQFGKSESYRVRLIEIREGLLK